MINEEFKGILRNNNYLLTKERVRLFDELKSSESPLSIHQLINRTQDSLDQTTVYRNLATFEELGVTIRIYTGWKYKVELSDKFKKHHHHMTCTECSEIISFHESPDFIAQLIKLEDEHGFKSESHSLELRGTCKSCNKLGDAKASVYA